LSPPCDMTGVRPGCPPVLHLRAGDDFARPICEAIVAQLPRQAQTYPVLVAQELLFLRGERALLRAVRVEEEAVDEALLLQRAELPAAQGIAQAVVECA